MRLNVTLYLNYLSPLCAVIIPSDASVYVNVVLGMTGEQRLAHTLSSVQPLNKS